jgi:GNAT superfamily N-acetyltransferase
MVGLFHFSPHPFQPEQVMSAAERPSLYVCHAAAYDAAALARLRAASLMEMGLLDPSDSDRFIMEARGELYRMLREERIAGWLLVDGDRPVGCAIALFWMRLPYPNGMMHAEIAGVYVEPAYRGMGFAKELIQDAIDAANARGARRIILHARTGTEQLYRGLGFVSSNEMVLERGVEPGSACSVT